MLVDSCRKWFIFLITTCILSWQYIYGRACTNGDLRLANGHNNMEGRVEVCSNGQWGTVCDDSWDYHDAQVVCKQLGLPYTGAVAYGSAHFGQGTAGSIVISGVQCTGDEIRLFSCSHNNLINNCAHSNDAGVLCQEAECAEGDIWLTGGQTICEGTVNICYHGVWSTVCDNGWSRTNANVVCRQLGYNTDNALSYSSAHYGQGTGPIYIDKVQCIGTESRLLECQFMNRSNCDHKQDSGVNCNCTQSSTQCNEGDVRLTGDGRTTCEGNVEICFRGVWGTVCDNYWSQKDAKVVCRQLGFSTDNVHAHSRAHFGQGTGAINIDRVICEGTETSLLNCSFIPAYKCGHYQDSGVSCNCISNDNTNCTCELLPADCTEGDVRLIGGNRTTTCEGTVEICYRGRWGTVCNNYWNRNDASVVCRQLGYSGNNAVPYLYAHFGQGTGLINIDHVNCKGNESSLLDCSFDEPQTCFYSEDAGVKCICTDTANCTCEPLPSVISSTAVIPLDTSTYIHPVGSWTTLLSPSIFSSSYMLSSSTITGSETSSISSTALHTFSLMSTSSIMPLISSMIPLTAVTSGISSMTLTISSVVVTKSTVQSSASTTAQLFSSLSATQTISTPILSSFRSITDTGSYHSQSYYSLSIPTSSTIESFSVLTLTSYSTAEAHWLTSSSAAVIQMSSSIDLLSSPAAVTSPSNTAAHHSLKEDFIIAGSVTGAVVFIAVIVLVSLTVFCLIRRYRRCSIGNDQELPLWRDDVTDTIFGPDDDNPPRDFLISSVRNL